MSANSGALMALTINPITPVISAEAAGPAVTLQPGSVIDAKVLQILANDFVRIAVASLSIEVASEVPLQVGQMLQLAVSQTPQGVRLQIVPQAADTSSPLQPATLISPTIAPNIAPSAANGAQGVSVTRPLTPLEVVAVAKALQTAAGQQGSLSPLFANLTVAATSDQLPDVLQQAAHSLLAGRPALNEEFSGDDLAAAFRQSGLFYEQSQKQAATSPATSGATTAPDLKAALIVFKQILGSWLGSAAQSPSEETGLPGQYAQQGQARAQAEINAPSMVPASMPTAEGEEIMLPGAVVSVTSEVEVEDLGDAVFSMRDAASPLLGKSGTASSADSMQMILRAFPKGVQDAVASLLAEEGTVFAHSSGAAGTAAAKADTDGVPPPFRGAATSAQPAVPPVIDHRTPPDAVAHRLLDDTDAALARQTLLQIASLPDQLAHTKFDPTTRWNFEVPFATPQGTTVAQFEISRDGGGDNTSTEAPSRVWRARFSINLEPAGPVHAQVSLAGERTSVRMWAERSATAARLRAEAPQLSQALREAELTPGDIVIGNGAPPAQTAPSGHFLDRAL